VVESSLLSLSLSLSLSLRTVVSVMIWLQPTGRQVVMRIANTIPRCREMICALHGGPDLIPFDVGGGGGNRSIHPPIMTGEGEVVQNILRPWWSGPAPVYGSATIRSAHNVRESILGRRRRWRYRVRGLGSGARSGAHRCRNGRM
jgi:hypothetical protein